MYILRDQEFKFNLIGFKPNTKHYFYFDGVDLSAECRLLNGKIGSDLNSEDDGSLNFIFYYSSDISAETEFTEELAEYSKIAGIKKIQIKNDDGSSYADTSIIIADFKSESNPSINIVNPDEQTNLT